MGTPQFVDVSQFQPEPFDWPIYKAWSAQWDGKSRVAMRSSYGNGYKDPVFDAHRANALAVGIDQIFYYHYAYPSLNSAIQEANSQFSFVGSIRPQDQLILDFEQNVAQATSAWAYSWLATQEANYGGKLPGLYASSAYILQRLQDARLARYPLWLANWQFTADERPACPPPWTIYEAVQYTDRAVIPGIAGNVDADIFLGKEAPIMSQITLSTPGVSQFFKANGQTWQCLKTGFLIGGGMLGLYQRFGGDGLCGLTYLGLPVSNEIAVAGHPGVVKQEFERGTLQWDPEHIIDSPPGAGDVYPVHVEQDPRAVALQAQITALRTQVSLLQSQVADLQAQLAGNALSLENQGLLAKIAAAQKDLS